MKNILKQYIFSFKFLILTAVVFSMCGIWTRLYLVLFKDDINFSILKSIIYAFNMEKGTIISINELKIISVYLVLFYLLIDFIAKYLSERKYLHIIRLKSLSKYINKLIIATYIISTIYFILGYGIICIVNYNTNIWIISINDIKFVSDLFIISNLTMFLFINIIILGVIYKNDFKIPMAVVIGIFLIGIQGTCDKIPAYYLYSYRILQINASGKIVMYTSYLISILITYLLIKKNMKKHKDFLLYEYEI